MHRYKAGDTVRLKRYLNRHPGIDFIVLEAALSPAEKAFIYRVRLASNEHDQRGSLVWDDDLV